MWCVPRMWDDGEVWIIGGGPSVPRMFGVSEEVISRVRAGESPVLYSEYMSPIHQKHSIAINCSHMIGGWFDMMFFGDYGFLRTHVRSIAAWPGVRVSSCQPPKGSPHNYAWIKHLKPEHRYGISNNPKTVCWNKNSGAAAISIAAHAGARRICLLGFDMQTDGAGEQHWHRVYSEGHNKTKEIRLLPFRAHLVGFEQIARDAKSRKIEILNVNEKSGITQFPLVKLKDVL